MNQKTKAMAIASSIGPWPSFQPSERVIHESNGNRFPLSGGEIFPNKLAP
jgi:hypothetical protein